MSIVELRQKYHSRICQEIIRVKRGGSVEYPNFADGNSKASVEIAFGILEQLGCQGLGEKITGQRAGNLFEALTKDFLEETLGLLNHLRPGNWEYSLQTSISNFDQYEHLAYLDELAKSDKSLASILGVGYIVKPDIVIGRFPVSDAEINRYDDVVRQRELANLTSLRESNHQEKRQLLHASVSCKWTLRSDRSQNARTEALNLVRNRKGNLPHVVAVTAEPLPTRIAALALGTGDLDCVYHFSLPELLESVRDVSEDQLDMLNGMVEGRRLRDISDLSFDLAI